MTYEYAENKIIGGSGFITYVAPLDFTDYDEAVVWFNNTYADKSEMQIFDEYADKIMPYQVSHSWHWQGGLVRLDTDAELETKIDCPDYVTNILPFVAWYHDEKIDSQFPEFFEPPLADRLFLRFWYEADIHAITTVEGSIGAIELFDDNGKIYTQDDYIQLTASRVRITAIDIVTGSNRISNDWLRLDYSG